MEYLISKTAAKALDDFHVELSQLFYWETDNGCYTSDQHLAESLEIIKKPEALNEVLSLAKLEDEQDAEAFRVYNHVATQWRSNPRETPHSIIIPQMLLDSLHKHTEREWGERVRETWYESYDTSSNTYASPVAKFEYTYTRDANNLYVVSRKMVLSWTLNNGEWSTETKTFIKYYTQIENQITELKRRRENLITDITVRALVFFGTDTPIKQLFADNMNPINRWRDSGDQTFTEILSTASLSQYPWIEAPIPGGNGATVRDLLVQTFSLTAGG